MAKIRVKYHDGEIAPPIPSIPGEAQTAYSLARIIPFIIRHVGPIFEIRRDDDDVLDIGTINGDVDELAITNFAGAGSAFITRLYDQSGNLNDWVQSTNNLQPRIINLGVLEKVNGKLAMHSDDVVGQHDLLTATLTGVFGTTAFHVYKTSRDSAVNTGGGNVAFYGLAQSGDNNDNTLTTGSPITYINGSVIGDSRDDLFVAVNGKQVLNTFTGLDLTNVNWFEFNTEYIFNSDAPASEFIQEVIIGLDNVVNKPIIEADMISYFSIPV